MRYNQCRLSRGNRRTVTWVPREFAKVGKVIKLRGDDDVWVDGWRVEEVWTEADDDVVFALERDHLKQRVASDV